MLRRLLPILAMLVGIMMFAAPAANAAYQRFLPNGLPTGSPQAAKDAVLKYAELNESYAKIIAAQTGSRTFNKNDYVSAGWSTASGSTTNSALSGTGAVVGTNGGVGVKTIRIRNTKTGLLVNVMVRCGNPRLKKGGVKYVPNVRVHKILRIWVNKKFTHSKTVTCPSGQSVTGTVTGYIRGWFKTRVKGWTTGARLWYKLQVDLKVTSALKLKCGAGPAGSTGVICKAGEIKNAAGNCVGQSNSSSQEAEVKNDCKGVVYGNQCITNIVQITYQINANCSQVWVVNGDNPSMVIEQQAVICSQVTNPPPPVNPPPANRPPTVEIYNPAKHVCSRETTTGGRTGSAGQVTLKVTASDPDGDNLGTPKVKASRGTVGLPTKIGDGQWTVRYTGPELSGTDTVWATVSDGEADPVTESIIILNPKVDLDNPSPTTC